MKGPTGYVQAYNCQAAVDATAQIIVAHSVSNAQNDGPELVPILAQIRTRLGRTPAELSADAGYLSEDNLTAAGPDQRALPLQILVNRDGQETSVLGILIEQALAAKVEEICVVVWPGDESRYLQAADRWRNHHHRGRIETPALDQVADRAIDAGTETVIVGAERDPARRRGAVHSAAVRSVSPALLAVSARFSLCSATK